MTDSQAATSKTAPRIWLVIGDKPGDNAQIDIIMQALDLPYEVRRMLPRPEYVLGKPRFDISLDHLDLERSDRLEPPWPDLILTIGRRPSMAALWVQEQSGMHSRIVLLGRPKRWKERFALIIVPSQYRMPPAPNVLHLDLPLMRVDEAAIAQAADAWRERLGSLPKPLTALFVGGPTKPFRMDAGTARDLLHKALDATGEGHLYISTSRRTPPVVVKTLQASLPANATLFSWAAEAKDNPYRGLLGLADRFIVTGDSMSMMVEVARLGKPLAIYPLPVRRDPASRLRAWLGGGLKAGAGKQPLRRLLAGIGAWLADKGIIGFSRDLTAIHRTLTDKRLAVRLGEPFITSGAAPGDELFKVKAALRELL
jgi:hypothetical protein